MIQPKKCHLAKQPGKPRADTSNAKDPGKVEMLMKSLENAMQTKPRLGRRKAEMR